jgi:DNA-binding protein HU-beta
MQCPGLKNACDGLGKFQQRLSIPSLLSSTGRRPWSCDADARVLAETVGLTKKQAVQTMEALVALAYKNAKNSFTIPGLGKIVLVNRKARMGRNPATGEIAANRMVNQPESKPPSQHRILACDTERNQGPGRLAHATTRTGLMSITVAPAHKHAD